MDNLTDKKNATEETRIRILENRLVDALKNGRIDHIDPHIKPNCMLSKRESWSIEQGYSGHSRFMERPGSVLDEFYELGERVAERVGLMNK